MPLKHATETLLVAILAFVLVCTGVIVASLPNIPEGTIPWGITVILAVLYPVLLYPLFRRDRADHTFRLLHWMPACMLLGWMALELLAYYFPVFSSIVHVFTWSWTLPIVTALFIWLALFCFKVLRQWSKRVAWMLIFFIPYAVFGIWSSTGPELEKDIAGMLWNGWWLETLGGHDDSTLVASSESSAMYSISSISQKNLEASSDISEQAWRDKLRAVEERSSASVSSKTASGEQGDTPQSSSSKGKWFAWLWGAENSEGSRVTRTTSSSASSNTPTVVRKDPSGQKNPEIVDIGTGPNRLPSAGFGWGFILLTMLAVYCGKIHSRQKQEV